MIKECIWYDWQLFVTSKLQDYEICLEMVKKLFWEQDYFNIISDVSTV